MLIVQPKVFADARGFFLESFNQRQFDAAVGAPVTFVQDNHSRSARGVLRGLHMQVGAHPQGKLVRVTSGRIFDVAVDVRRGEPDLSAVGRPRARRRRRTASCGFRPGWRTASWS